MNGQGRQKGQSMMEYLVVSIVILVILGATSFGDGSVIDLFLTSVRDGFDRFSHFMSLP